MALDKEIKRETRLLALEYMASHTYNMVLKLVGASEEAISIAESEGLSAIGLQRLVDRDPAMSDHMSAELRDAIEDLMRGAREMRAMAQTPE
jgi:hypothetical protein